MIGYSFYYKFRTTHKWEPQADITLFELALAIPFLQRKNFSESGYIVDFEFHIVPENIRRHFKTILPKLTPNNNKKRDKFDFGSVRKKLL